MTNPDFRCGTVALLGKPNVGKSTLLNAMIGAHLAATADKPQTTRHRILGINTDDVAQLIFLDTPGLHAKAPRALNRQLNRTAVQAIAEVDVLAFVTSGTRFTEDDEHALKQLITAGKPVVLIINKVDQVPDKALLLPFTTAMLARHPFVEIVMVSATKRTGLDRLKKALAKHLPAQAAIFEADEMTDRSERFIAAELIREQLVRLLGEELPYTSTVVIDEFKLDGTLKRISATIFVEREGQKAIVIGDAGARLKAIGSKSRLAMERLFDTKVFLQLWVKVKTGWSDDERALKQLGYQD
jgi:GTPase